MHPAAMSWLRRNWFLCGVAAVCGLGVAWPQAGQRIAASGVVLPVLVAVTLFVSGYLVDSSRLARQAINLRAIAVTMAAAYALAPAIAVGLGQGLVWFPAGLDAHQVDGVRQALVLTMAQAGTLVSAIAYTMVARGDRELAIVLTLVSNAATPVLTPLVLEVGIGAQVTLPVAEMMQRLVYTVLLPVVAGLVAQRLIRIEAPGGRLVLRLLPQVIVLVFVYTGFSAAAGTLGARPDLVVLVLVLCLTMRVALMAGTLALSLLARFDGPARTAVVLCGSQKTLPNGVYLWREFFAANPFCPVALIVFHVVQLVFDSLVLRRLRGTAEASNGDVRVVAGRT